MGLCHECMQEIIVKAQTWDRQKIAYVLGSGQRKNNQYGAGRVHWPFNHC